MTNENPYASPASEEIGPPAIWIDGAPRGVTLVDGLVLGLGIVAAVGLFAVTRGIDSLWLPSAKDAWGIYVAFYSWLELAAQATGWVVLVRVWRYGVMPRAWEWLSLWVWLELWPGRVWQPTKHESLSAGLTRVGEYHAVGLVIQLLVTVLLSAALVALVAAFVRYQPGLNAVAKVASLLGLMWILFAAILPAGNHAFAILLEILYPDRQAPQLWYSLYSQLYTLPRETKWWIPLFAGFLIMGTPRRWTEWAGVPYHPMQWVGVVWFMVILREEWAILVIGLFLAIGLSCLVLRWRHTLVELFGLSDLPSTPTPSEILPSNQPTA